MLACVVVGQVAADGLVIIAFAEFQAGVEGGENAPGQALAVQRIVGAVQAQRSARLPPEPVGGQRCVEQTGDAVAKAEPVLQPARQGAGFADNGMRRQRLERLPRQRLAQGAGQNLELIAGVQVHSAVEVFYFVTKVYNLAGIRHACSAVPGL